MWDDTGQYGTLRVPGPVKDKSVFAAQLEFVYRGNFVSVVTLSTAVCLPSSQTYQ